MAETTEKTGEKKLSVAPSKTLSLKGRGVEQGVVRQSFSHGRTKAVVVEKVKSRVTDAGESRDGRPGRARQAPGARQGRQRGTGRSAGPEPAPARRRNLQGSCCEPSPRKSARPVRARWAMPGCARPKSARLPRKRR